MHILNESASWRVKTRQFKATASRIPQSVQFDSIFPSKGLQSPVFRQNSSMEFFTADLILPLLLVAFIAGFVDAIAGGGGLLVLPSLLVAGLSPAQALATNKLQGTFGTFSATATFVRSGHVALTSMHLPILMTAVGAIAGTVLAQILEATFLRQLIPVLLMAIAVYYIFSPQPQLHESDGKLNNHAFSMTAAQGVGFYDGFFGPGAGAFYTTSYVILRGYSLLRATAHSKVLNFTSNIVSLCVFILGGQVVWMVGLSMGAAQLLGANLGSRLVINKGTQLIRPVLITVSLLITINLIATDPKHFIYQWFASMIH